MLLTKTVKMKWNRGTCTYYKKLGYKYTRIGDEFEVKVEDLTKGSHALVKVKCDCIDCNNPILNMEWKTYLLYVKENDIYYCTKCSNKICVADKMVKTKLKNGKSFEQWCIENNYQDVLDRWDYELNDKKPNEICYSTSNKYYFKCPKGIHESELKNIGNFTNGHEGTVDCKQCNSFAQWGIDNLGENFLEKYWDYNKNTVSPWEISKSCSKKIYIKCQEKGYHGSYLTNCAKFSNGHRCSYCNNKRGKIHPLDSLGKLLEDKSLGYVTTCS